jgi:hypothetical protein
MKPRDVPYLVRVAAIFGLASGFITTSRAELITQWNFNSVPPDGNVQTGTNVPSAGVGAAALVGGATAIYSTGSAADPAESDNSDWNTRSYPAQGTGNKTRGVRFNASTLGYDRIMVTWVHRHSGTASRYVRFQYSTNGVDFIDGPSFSTDIIDIYHSRSVNLSAIASVNDNPDFAFRIVSEFESSAIGNENSNYVATAGGGTYGTGGTWRFDMMTVSGGVFSGNQFPTVSSISNQTMRTGELGPEIPFSIGDFETPADLLTLSRTSSNPAVIPEENISFFGSESNRTVRLFPASDGTSIITITVTDGEGNATSTSFVVTVLPPNTPPTISSFTNYNTMMNTPLARISFLVGDAESPAGVLTVTGTSSNPALIADTNIVFGGESSGNGNSGSNRFVVITPAAEETGNAVITVTVSDGMLTTSREFAVMVVPSASVLLCEPFAYPDGPLNTNSAFRWSNHSGFAGQARVQGEELQLTSALSEDTSAVLIGAPYYPTNGKALYAGFTINFSALPSGLGEYFAHFRENPATFRARVFATTTNVTPGAFRLAIGNGAGNIINATNFPMDLNPGTTYAVVVRYDVASAVSTLWINPRSEGDASVVAADSTAAVPIIAWAFRQSASGSGTMGSLKVDDLKVGCSFSDVLPGYRLQIRRSGSAVEISWPAAASDLGFFLESTSDLMATWQSVADLPVRVGNRDHVIVTSSMANSFYRLGGP